MMTICCFVFRQDHILLGRQTAGPLTGQYVGLRGPHRPTDDHHEIIRSLGRAQLGIDIKHTQPAGSVLLHRDGRDDEREDIYRASEFEHQPHHVATLVPEWFLVDRVPYQHLRADHALWLPLVAQHRFFRAEIWFARHDQLLRHTVTRVP